MARFTLHMTHDNVMRVLLCLGVLLLAFALLVYPEMRRITRLEGEIAQLQTRIEQQKILYPVYRDLLATYQNSTVGGLPRVALKPLPQAEIGSISEVVGNLARSENLSVRSVVPNPDSLAAGGGLISVKCVFLGDLFAFRKFCLALGGLPSLAHVERIQVEDTYDGRIYRVDLWLALEGKA